MKKQQKMNKKNDDEKLLSLLPTTTNYEEFEDFVLLPLVRYIPSGIAQSEGPLFFIVLCIIKIIDTIL